MCVENHTVHLVLQGWPLDSSTLSVVSPSSKFSAVPLFILSFRVEPLNSNGLVFITLLTKSPLSCKFSLEAMFYFGCFMCVENHAPKPQAPSWFSVPEVSEFSYDCSYWSYRSILLVSGSHSNSYRPYFYVCWNFEATLSWLLFSPQVLDWWLLGLLLLNVGKIWLL